MTATAVDCQASRFRQWSETSYSESGSSNEAEGCLFSARLCTLSLISRCGSVLRPLCCYLSTNFNVRLVSYTLWRRHLHVDSDQAPRHCITVCFCLSVSGLSASPPSSSLPLKPWTRAASGADSPPVIRWLLNTPQQKHRKYVWWATAGPVVIISGPLTALSFNWIDYGIRAQTSPNILSSSDGCRNKAGSVPLFAPPSRVERLDRVGVVIYNHASYVWCLSGIQGLQGRMSLAKYVTQQFGF